MNFYYAETVLICILNHVTQIDMIVLVRELFELDCSLDHALHNNHNGFHKTEILRIGYFFFCAKNHSIYFQ